MTCLGRRITVLGITQLVLLVQALSAHAASSATLKIPDSTPVLLTMMDRLNSATSEIDDPVHFEVAEDVKLRGLVQNIRLVICRRINARRNRPHT